MHLYSQHTEQGHHWPASETPWWPVSDVYWAHSSDCVFIKSDPCSMIMVSWKITCIKGVQLPEICNIWIMCNFAVYIFRDLTSVFWGTGLCKNLIPQWYTYRELPSFNSVEVCYSAFCSVQYRSVLEVDNHLSLMQTTFIMLQANITNNDSFLVWYNFSNEIKQ